MDHQTFKSLEGDAHPAHGVLLAAVMLQELLANTS